jgi:hypothetical protein
MERDEWPTWDDAAVERMIRLKQALENGNYDEEFDKMFPPEDSDDHRGGE